MEKETSFFDRLTFDPTLSRSFIAAYFQSTRAIILIILTLTVAGLATFFSLPKELNPNIQIPIVFVSTPYPGAGPEDIETLVTIPLEDAVSGLSGVENISSTSQENVSVMSIEFVSGTDPQRAKEDVQSALDSVTDLPADAESPQVQVLDFQNQPVITFSLSSDGDTETLNRFSDLLEDRLKDISSIEKVSVSYRNDPDIAIVLKPDMLREKNLSPDTISQAVRRALSNYPAGNLSTDSTVFALTQKTSARSLEDLRMLPIHIGGDLLPLGEIASINEEPSRNTPSAYYADARIDGKKAVTFSVFKTDEADAIATVASVFETSSDLNIAYGNQFVIEALFDGAKEIQKSFDQLFHDFALTIFFVFTVLFIFFGLRQSIIAALAIPLTFLGTFLVMSASGISINFIALFSLLLALGILVDNAIVIISAMASYERTKKFTPDETALLVWRDFRAVIFTTTITTMWAFLPLLLASGIIGEFIKPIPIVVSASLAISAVIALLIVTPLMALLLKGSFPRRVIIALYSLIFIVGIALLYVLIPAGRFQIPLLVLSILTFVLLLSVLKSFREKIHLYEESHFTKFFRTLHTLSGQGLFSLDHLAHRYERFIQRVLISKSARRRTMIALIIFSVFSYALVPLGYVVNEFFPADDLDYVYISVELPKSTALGESREEALRLLHEFRSYPDARFVYAEIGAAPPTDNGPITGQEFNKLLFTFLLYPKDEREKTSGEIVRDLNRTYGAYTNGRLSASQLSGGPPAGSDLQMKLLGKDLPTLQHYATQVSEYLKSQEGVTNVSVSIVSGASKIVYIPNNEKFAREGISPTESAFFLRTLGSGFVVKSDARLGDEKRDIVLRLTDAYALDDPQMLGRLSLPTADGDIPLLALGDFVLEPNPTLITREDQRRTLSISASVEKGFSISTLNKGLEDFADTLGLPDGYTWKTGGVNDENNKSVQSILKAMLLSALLIFGTMAIQFNSFRKALIVLMVIPLAVSGVFIFFSLTGTPLSFPALIGILALFGIVVNNSIIMVDKINRNMDAGLPLNQAISEGAASRLEPILLTALTTIVGLIPITLSDPIWQGLGGAIIAGLTFSGVAKLFFIPVIYRVWFGEKDTQEASGFAIR